jgi:hypothetical protein
MSMDTTRYVELRRVRDFGATINVIFEFLRANWKPLGKSVLYILAPVLIIGAVITGVYLSTVLSGAFGRTVVTPDDVFGLYGQMLPVFGAATIVLTIAITLMAAVVTGYVRLYIDRRGESTIEVDEVWREARQSFFRVLGTTIVAMLIAYAPMLVGLLPALLLQTWWLIPIGIFLAVIPTIYLYTCLSIIVPMRLEEEIGVFEAVARCIALMKGRWWFSFGVYFIISMVIGFVGMIFQAPIQIVSMMSGFSGEPPSPAVLIPLGAFSAIGTYLLYSVLFLTSSVLYYNLVERKEGVGMVDRIKEIGGSIEEPGATSL